MYYHKTDYARLKRTQSGHWYIDNYGETKFCFPYNEHPRKDWRIHKSRRNFEKHIRMFANRKLRRDKKVLVNNGGWYKKYYEVQWTIN